MSDGRSEAMQDQREWEGLLKPIIPLQQYPENGSALARCDNQDLRKQLAVERLLRDKLLGMLLPGMAQAERESLEKLIQTVTGGAADAS